MERFQHLTRGAPEKIGQPVTIFVATPLRPCDIR
jgi:hypothetical protein